MIQVNLLPWREYHMQHWRRRWVNSFIVQLALIVLITLMIEGGFRQQRTQLTTLQHDLQQKSILLQNKINLLNIKIQKQKRIAGWLSRADSLIQQGARRSARLAQLAVWVPDNAWLVRVKDDENLYLEGCSKDYGSIVTLLKQLRGSPDLFAVELDSVTHRGEDDHLCFSLSAQLREIDIAARN